MPGRKAACIAIPMRRQRDIQKQRGIDYSLSLHRAYFVRQRVDAEVTIRAKYERANHHRQIIVDRRSTRTQTALITCLHEHIERWKSETIHWSSITRRLAHPSYLRIIGLAKYFTNYVVERALLQELQTDPDYWFPALNAITGEDPAQPEYNAKQTIAAWLAWGYKKGIV